MNECDKLYRPVAIAYGIFPLAAIPSRGTHKMYGLISSTGQNLNVKPEGFSPAFYLWSRRLPGFVTSSRGTPHTLLSLEINSAPECLPIVRRDTPSAHVCDSFSTSDPPQTGHVRPLAAYDTSIL
jgi:hypothetical protein